MPKRDALSFIIAGLNAALIIEYTLNQTTVPIMLNDKCTIAARFAFLFAPIDEIIAVTHVPIFCPIIIGIAAP